MQSSQGSLVPGSRAHLRQGGVVLRPLKNTLFCPISASGSSAFGGSNSAVLQNCLDLEQNWTFFKGLNAWVHWFIVQLPSWYDTLIRENLWDSIMKLSFAISMQQTAFDAVGRGDWKEILAYMVEMGYDGIELAIGDPVQVDTMELRDHLNQHDLCLAAIGTGQAYHDQRLCLVADEEQVRVKTVELLRSHIELAANFGAIVIIGLVRGKLKEQSDPKRAYSYFGKNMVEIDRHAQEFGVDLAIEPINRYETDYLNTVDRAVGLIDVSGLKRTGILLDTFHMNIEEPKWDESIRMASKYLKHVHIADSNRQHPGRGHINFPEIFRLLNEAGYKGFYSGEMLPVPNLQTAIRDYYNYMRSFQ